MHIGNKKDDEENLSEDSICDLRTKIFSLQEELTNLHKSKGENAQKVITLNNEVQNKEQEIESKNEDSLEEKYKKCIEDNNFLVERWLRQKSQDIDRVNEENAMHIKNLAANFEEQLNKAISKNDTTALPQESDFCDFTTCLSTSLNFASSSSGTIPTKSINFKKVHDDEINCVVVIKNPALPDIQFATGSSDRKIKLWTFDGTSLEKIKTLIGSSASVNSIHFNSESTHLIATSNDFATRVWALDSHRLLHTLTGHSGKVLAAKFMNGKDTVVTGSHDRTVKIWDLAYKTCTKTIFCGSKCFDVQPINEVNVIISSHYNRTLRFYDLHCACESPSSQIEFSEKITMIDISPNKYHLLVTSRDNFVFLVDTRKIGANYESCVIKKYSDEDFKLGCDLGKASFCGNDDYLACGSNDGSIFFWNTSSEKALSKVKEKEQGNIISCTWSMRGNFFISADSKGHITTYE